MKKTRRTKKNRKGIFSALVSFLLILAMVGSLTSTAMASQPEEADAEEETAETPAADTDAVEEPAAETDAEAEPAAAIGAEEEPTAATDAEAELSHVSVPDETVEPTGATEDIALLSDDAAEAEEDAVVPLDGEEGQAYAVYTQGDEASNLTFYYGTVPEGEYVYTGMDTDVYEEPGDVPWAEVAEHVKAVSFDSSFADVKPVSTSCWFANFTECATIDLTNLDTSNVTTMYKMFYYCQRVQEIDASGFDTSKVENMAYMFREDYYLASVDVADWDTSSLTNACRLFDGCISLADVDVSEWDMSNVEDISHMFCTTLVTDDVVEGVEDWDTSSVTRMDGVFYECTAVTSLDLSKWDVSNVTSMMYLFENCSGLKSVNLTGWDTSKVTTMRRMFRECTALASVDVSGFDMEHVTDTTDMFYDCKSLASLDVSNFETGDMTDMSGMFSECMSLASLDVSSFDTSNVTDMSYMFQGCSALTALNLTNFDTSNVTDMTGMFEDCEKLEGVNLSSFNTKNVEAFDQFLYDCEALEWITIGDDFDLFARSTEDNAVLSIATWYDLDGEMVSSNYMIGFTGGAGTYVSAGENATIFAVYSADDDSLTFYYDEGGRPAKGETYHEKTVTDVFIGFDMLRYTAEHVPWHSYREDIVSVVVDASFEKVEPVSAAYWFYDFANCTSFDLQYLDTSLETDMTDLFCGCSSVEKLDLSGFDTKNVTDMESMFDSCTSLQEITWGEKFDTSKVTDMSYMFYGCRSLTELDLSKFNTSNVASMEGMFFNSTALTGLDLSKFDTSKVTTMESMFQGCTSLAELDLSGWEGKTSSVTTMLTMFQGCTGLQKLDATGLVSSNVTNLQDMFYGCSALADLDMSEWDTSGVENMHRMFRDCSSLTEIDVSGFDTENVTQFSQTFYGCSGLTELDLSHFDTTSLNTMANMFNGCSGLVTLSLRGWDTSGTTLMASEFSGCTSLTTIYVNEGDFDTSHEENDTNMFNNCVSIVGGNGTTYDASEVNHNMAHIDTPGNPGYLTNYTLFAVYCAEDGSLTICADTEVPSAGDTYNEKEATVVYTDILDTGEEAPPWEDVKGDILTVSCEKSIESFSPKSFYEWFAGMENCTSVDLTYLNTTDAAVYTDIMTGMDNLEILSIGENFTLFTESAAALVPQQNWYDADGVQRSDDYMIGISEAGTYYTSPCYLEHHFLGEPVYTWAEDFSSCTAAFTCECGEVTETVDCTVTSEMEAGETLFTATCEFNGNVYTDEVPSKKIDVSGTITWDDANNQDGKRPGFVKAQLFAQDSDEGILYSWEFEVAAPADPEYDGDGNEIWTWTRTDLDQYYSGGEEVKYTVIYEGVDLDVYEQTVPNDLDTIYSYTPATTEISGSKTWVDDDDADELRPESITVRLHANGNENVYEQTVTAADGWAWEFTDLPVYENGHPITYTLTEDAVDNYDATYDGWDITNTLDEGNTSVTVLKDWEDAEDQDGKRPASVTVELLADGQETGETLTLSEENGWEDDFTGLAIYSGGVRIQYTVAEIDVGVEGYTSEMTGNAAEGFVFTNSYTPELLNGDGILTGTKVWEDADDQDGIRPDSIYVHLLADGIAIKDVEVDANGDGTFAFEDLDKYAAGTEIEYTVEEVLDSHLQDAYTGEVTGSMANGFTITNTHTPELLNGDGTLTVTKVWDDADDQDGLRPEGVTVHLLADGEEVDFAILGSEAAKTGLWQSVKALFTGTQTLAADVDGWTATFTDLPKYRDGGEEIVYTITEDGVDAYETAVSGDTASGFTVTNAHTPATITLSGQKIWDDANDQDGKRPVSITINLLADGEAALDENGHAITAVVNEEDNGEWTWDFSGLPQYRDGGTAIDYTMEEDMTGLPDGYTATTTGTMADGFTITNSYTPELYNGDGTFRVVLVWDDEANNDGIRPTEVNIKLTKNQTTVDGAEMTLTADETDADGNWTCTFTDLPKYENGSEITYSVKEDVKSGYTYRVELLTDESGNTYVQLTNVHVSVKENIEVTKIWDDADDQDGKRPESITVRLLTNGNLYKEKVLTADTEGVTVSADGNVWQYTMTDIPVDKNGEAIEYTMLEVDVDNYGTPEIETIRGDEITDEGVTYRPYSFVVTNSHTPEQIDITGEKVWDDANDQDGIRPQYVTIHLYADGEKVADTDVTAANDTDGDGSWEWAFTGFDKYINGREIEYTVTEDAVEDYDTTITGNAADGFTVTNSYTPETTSISGSKTWVDDDNAANTRPASITVRLHANGTEEVYEQTVTAADGWAWEFTDLPVYSNGQQIDYTLTEDAVDDYDTTYTFGDDGSLDVTNTLSPGNTSLTVDKDWEDNHDQDGIRPAEVTVELLRDGSATGQTLTLSADDHWTDTFHNLQEYEGGVRIDYTVQEVSVGDYDSKISGDEVEGYVITNTHTPATIELSGSKVWKDADDQDGIRPDSITIHLLADGETVESKSVTADDGWEWTFEGLDQYASGTEIAYTMEEAYVADGYEVESGDASNDYTFTNTHEPEKIDITGTKTWQDDDNRDGVRPTSITVNLLANGEPALDESGNPISTTVEPDADGSWNYTFPDLDKCAGGKEIEYSIAEEVPDGYTAAYTYSGYDVTNNHTPELINGDGKLDVIMHWDDESNQDGLRPKRTTITLMVNGVPDETITLVLSDDNVDEYGNWIGTFTDLYKYEEGEEIAYNVEEGVMNGYTYTAELVFDEDTGRYYVEITNTHAAVTSDITVTKVWDDNDDQDGIRPDSVIVNLFSNGSAVKSVTLTPGKEGVVVSADGNEWSYTFTNMPVDMNGEAILYTLDEVDVGSYAHEIETTKVEGNEKDGVTYTEYAFTVTNTHTPGTTVVSGEKIWDDADDQDGLRPHSITIELLADGVPALDENGEEITQLVTPHTDGSWTWSFTDIPKYREVGTEIVYSFEEFAVEGYETSYSADGLTITNTHEPETRDISGNKVWDDDDDRDAKRPASITVNLYANGLVYDTKTVTAADNWEWTFENVPEYANGQRITHVTTEVAIDEYDTTYSGFTLINAYDPEKTSVTVIADWEDEDDQDGLRPTEITVPLLADGKETDQTLTLSEDENGIWEGTFTGLNEYSEGTRITYTIGEVSVDGYDCVVEGDASKGFSLTFTHTPEMISLEGSKTWNDADDQDGLRPDEITIHLLADGEEIFTENVTPVAAGPLRKLASIVTFGLVSAEDDWSFEFTDLPKYANGQEITYTITEAAVTGYDTTITGDAAEGFEIVNTHTPAATTVSGTKEWHDANDQDGKRPANIVINLQADGETVQSLEVAETDGDWGWTFADLPKYEDGEEITYTVTEDAVEEYDTQIVGDAATGFTVINSHTPEEVTISGSKTWDDEDDQDGSRPGSVTIRLHANGEVIATRTVTAYDSWRWTFANQPKYEDGVEIAYTITEDAIDDYSATVDGYDVTNSYTPGQTSLTVIKDWEDADDQDGIRPGSVTVELLADGAATGQTLTLSEANGWEDTFTGLDEYEAGERIVYTVAEIAVDGYTSELSGNETEGYVFTNTHEPETIDVFGSKVWDDGNDQDGIRPETITIHLLAGGHAVKNTVVTGAAGENQWDWEFSDLPRYENGQEITYTVAEDEVAGYTSELTGSEEDGYVFTNTHEPETVTVSGSKTWDDNEDQDGIRPGYITVELLADGAVVDTKTVTASDDWAWTFADLPKYESGAQIEYSIAEVDVEGYTSEITGDAVEGYVVTNTHEPETVTVAGSKTWDDNDDQDGKRPESITIHLHADGAVIDTATVTADDDWAWTFADLPKYENGHAITYAVTEDALDDYSATVSG